MTILCRECGATNDAIERNGTDAQPYYCKVCNGVDIDFGTSKQKRASMTLQAIIDDGYTLDGFITGGDDHPSLKFQYRPSLSAERATTRRLMLFHTVNTELDSLVSSRAAIQLALANSVDKTSKADLSMQVANLTKMVVECEERFNHTLEEKCEKSERLAARYAAKKVVNWDVDIPINEDSMYSLHPDLSGALFAILMGLRKSDKPEDPDFDEEEAVGNSSGG